MIIKLKNKHTLEVDEFQFRCSIGKNGTIRKKEEGDLKTPKGLFKLKEVFYRSDRASFKKFKIKSYWDSKKKLGVCADWFVGPRLESGWISAHDLFKKISR